MSRHDSRGSSSALDSIAFPHSTRTRSDVRSLVHEHRLFGGRVGQSRDAGSDA